MKKIIALLMALTLTLAFVAGCGSSQKAPAPSSAAPSGSNSEADTSLDDVIKAGKLVMLTNAGFPPFEYIEGTTPIGVDIDVAQAIADELGVKLEVVDMDFDGLVNALVSGKGDMIAAGMSITQERLQSVDFTDEYVTSAQYMIVKEGSDIKSLENLKGKAIGVQAGTTGDFIISDEIDLPEGTLHGTGASIKHYKTALEAALDLKAGRLDAVVVDKHPAQAIAQKNEGLVVADEAISEAESYAIAVNKGKTALLNKINEVLQKLIKEGKVDEFLVKHTAG